MNLERPGIFFKSIHFVRLMVVVLLANIAILGFIVLPNKARIKRQQEQYQSLRRDVAAEKKGNQELLVRLEKLQQAQKDITEMYAKIFVPKKKGATDIRLELESLIRNNQIQRTDVRHSNTPLPDYKLQQYSLGVPVEGTYVNIRRFINDIERSEHFLILDRVDLASEKKGDVLTLDFELSTYLVDNEI
jgi:Tfp pilus assembly protein PilO